MKIMKRVSVLAVLILMNASIGYACSCIGPANAKEGLAKADAVFSGRVIKSDSYEYEFEVERIWKGKIKKDRITVAASAPNTSCAIELNQGEQYIVFARLKKEGERIIYYPQICNFTSVYSKAEPILKVVGKGKLLKKRKRSMKE